MKDHCLFLVGFGTPSAKISIQLKYAQSELPLGALQLDAQSFKGLQAQVNTACVSDACISGVVSIGKINYMLNF
jgi:hypothetical protein